MPPGRSDSDLRYHVTPESCRELLPVNAPDPFDRLVDEYLDQLLLGKAPDLDTFLARHPELPDAARERLGKLGGLLGGTPAREAAEPLPFERLGEFVLSRRLGAGGMGEVFLAQQESLGRDVAIKMMHPALRLSQRAGSRFQREARLVAGLRHENIATLYELGDHEGVPFLVMEYIAGKGLDEILEAAGGKPLPVAQSVRWCRDIARALHYAHGQDVIHRDIKPSNLRVNDAGRILLLDFGLARHKDSEGLSLTGSFRGTPYYASPEQVEPRPAPVGAPADIYSLGVTLYECVTGRLPFRGETQGQVFQQILHADPASPRRINPGVTEDLEAVILMAMEKDSRRRYQTAGEFAADLDALLNVQPVRARPLTARRRFLRLARRRPALTTAVLLGLVILVGGPLFFGLQQSAARRRIAAEQRLTEAARIEEEQARSRAEDLFQSSLQQSVEFLEKYPDQVAMLRGGAPISLYMMDTIIDNLDVLRAKAGPGSGVALALSRALIRRGDLLGNPLHANRGEFEQGEQQYERALDLALLDREERGATFEGQLQVAYCHVKLAMVQFFRREHASAHETIAVAQELYRDLLEERPEHAGVRFAYSGVLSSLGMAVGNEGDHALALEYFDEAILVIEEGDMEGPQERFVARQKLAQLIGQRGSALCSRGQIPEGIEEYRIQLEMLEELRDEFPDLADFEVNEGQARILMANFLRPEGEWEEALWQVEQAIQLFAEMERADEADERSVRLLADAYSVRGDLCVSMDEAGEVAPDGGDLRESARVAYRACLDRYYRLRREGRLPPFSSRALENVEARLRRLLE